ncbi:hypothetical protein AAC691_17015 [Nguyenibacter vanlangensis]|uniref:Alginate export domain-containing protein n=1 Tax=Nguyenibacter vanlangensis TaxID=1216886 RepID=A0ABZ3D2I0_9PROT
MIDPLPQQHEHAPAQNSKDGDTQADILKGIELQAWYQSFHEFAFTYTGKSWGTSDNTRIVTGYRRHIRLGKHWSIALSDRLDLIQTLHNFRPAETTGSAASHTLNALREVSASWRGSGANTVFIDLGRINIRNGVASGYNPTDFFKTNSVLQATTLDPSALREDRLGVFMVRAQKLWSWGGVTAAYAPRLSSQHDPFMTLQHIPAFSLDLNRTNTAHTGYFKISPQISQRLSVDAIAVIREHETPRIGIDSSALIGDSIVVYAEAAISRFNILQGPDALTAVPEGTMAGIAGPVRWRARIAAGLTWTTPIGISLTLENHYTGDALSHHAWNAWRSTTNEAALDRLSLEAARRSGEEEPITCDAWFFRISDNRVFGRRGLGFSAFTFIDSQDGSTLTQMTLSQALTRHLQLTAQLGLYTGDARSDYGSGPATRFVSAYLSYRL